jgi:glycosyltransferase involved in cell wall biosynthesis
MLIVPILQGLSWALLLIEIAVALPILYLGIISISAIVTAKKRQAQRERQPIERQDTNFLSFGILIPAHNEEVLLGKLLDNLEQLDYPPESYHVYVVADNCTDSTPSLARLHKRVGVYERFHAEKRGKGYALHWLMERLNTEGHIHDAYVILDADSLVVPEYLRVLAHELQQGAQALQGHNTVLNPTLASSTVLRWIALTLMNHVRPLGRMGIGGSSTITGNGFCLSRALLERYPWQSYSLAEDYHYYLSLVQHGERVRYVPEALVRSDMPTSFNQMRTQDIRWEAQDEAGTTWRTAWRLWRSGIREGDFKRVEAVAELLTPPLSLLVGSSVLLFLASLILGGGWQIGFGLFLVGGLFLYLGSALYLVRMPLAAYRALLYAPGFMLWKLWVYFVLSRSKKHTSTWVRTSRPNSTQS